MSQPERKKVIEKSALGYFFNKIKAWVSSLLLSGTDMSSASRIAAWDGNTLKAITPDNVAESMTATKGVFTSISTSNCGPWMDGYYEKVGTLVTICLASNNAVELTMFNSVHIGTLPSDCRPVNRVFVAAATNVAGVGAQIHIDPDGKIYITSKAGSIDAGNEFYFNVAFHTK